MAGCYVDACTWIRGEMNVLTHLDGDEGIAIHPQHLLDEVHKRGKQQFTKGTDEAKRLDFLFKHMAIIVKHMSVICLPLSHMYSRSLC